MDDISIMPLGDLPDFIFEEIEKYSKEIQRIMGPFIEGKDLNILLAAIGIFHSDIISKYCQNPLEVAKSCADCLVRNVQSFQEKNNHPKEIE